MTRPRRGYTDGPFGQIHYQDTGGEGFPLVLCHQAPMTSRQYDTVYPLLSAEGIRELASIHRDLDCLTSRTMSRQSRTTRQPYRRSWIILGSLKPISLGITLAD